MFRDMYRRVAPGVPTLAVVLASLTHTAPARGQGIELQQALDLARGSDLVSPLETGEAFLLRPSLAARLFGAEIDLRARLAGFGNDSWSSALDGRLRLPALEMEEVKLRAVGGLDAEANWYADRSKGASAIGRGRLEFGDERFALWAGVGGGGAHDSRVWRGLSLIESGARGVLGGVDFRLSAESRSVNVTLTGLPSDTLRQGVAGGEAAQDGLLGLSSQERQQLRYLDAELSLGWDIGRLRLQAALGARQGNEFVDSDRWAHLQASVPINRRLTAMASAGRLPGRPEQGIRTREYYMLGLRLKFPGSPSSAPSEPGPKEPDGIQISEPGVDHLRTIRVDVPGATRVEMMGDFNAWISEAMTPVGGTMFELRERLAPGVYRVNMRVDGGPWIVPPGLTGIQDEFNGRVGLLVIQAGA